MKFLQSLFNFTSVLYDTLVHLGGSVGCRAWIMSLVARFRGPAWGPSGADRTQVGPMLAPWTLLSGVISLALSVEYPHPIFRSDILKSCFIEICNFISQNLHVRMYLHYMKHSIILTLTNIGYVIFCSHNPQIDPIIKVNILIVHVFNWACWEVIACIFHCI